MRARLYLSGLLYPRPCIREAILAYAHLCSVEVRDETLAGCSIEVEAHSSNLTDASRVSYEFLNYLLDLSLEHHLLGKRVKEPADT
jgi:hypothetical protein